MKLAAKTIYAVFFLLTSIYGLLAFIPFTFQQVIKGELFPPLNQFGRMQPYLFWFVLFLVNLAVGVARTRASTLFVSANILLGIYLFRWPVLTHLENNGAAMGWAIAFLAPIVWLTALDWMNDSRTCSGPAKLPTKSARRFAPRGK